jgi:hypothetical protein
MPISKQDSASASASIHSFTTIASGAKGVPAFTPSPPHTYLLTLPLLWIVLAEGPVVLLLPQFLTHFGACPLTVFHSHIRNKPIPHGTDVISPLPRIHLPKR